MLIRYKCKEGQEHIKCIPLIPVTDKAKTLTLTRSQIQLLPGTNEITDDEWEVIQPHIKAEIAAGTIVAVSKTIAASKGKNAKPSKAKDMKDMPVGLAVKFVADCVNPDTLNKWYKSEARDEVRLAIVKRMEELKIDVPKSKLEGGEDDDIENDDDLEGSGKDEGPGSGAGEGGE